MFNNLLRFYLMALSSPIFVTRMSMKYKKIMKHPERYTEDEKLNEARKILVHMKRRSRTKSYVYGLENIPKEGGCVYYSNHQGKYDAFGIMLSLDKPCAVLMEDKQSRRIVARQVVDYVEGKRIDFADPKQQLSVLNEIATEVKQGKRYLIFPEGGYTDNHNNLQKFNAGCFRCSLGSKTPIVPVVIIDSWKSMNTNEIFKPVITQVHYLEPIPFEVYGTMKKTEVSNLVKERIQAKLDVELVKKNRDKAQKII